MKKTIKMEIKNGTKRIIYLLVMTVVILIQDKTAWAQQYLPRCYWTFDGVNPLKDSINNYLLDPNYFSSVYTVSNAAAGIGKSLTFGNQTNIIEATNTVGLDSTVTIEFLYKPSHDMNYNTQIISRRDGAFYVKIGYPYIAFGTAIVTSTGATVNDDFSVNLTGVGRGSYSYYMDGNFHHYVFKYNATSGAKEIWIDGQLPVGFSNTTVTGHFNLNAGNTTNNTIDISSNTSYRRVYGDIDELAIYNISLPSTMIYKHYNEFSSRQHYSFNASAINPPAATSIIANVDLNEFAPGHPSYTVNALDQLRAFPLPRYKKNHQLLPNFNWLGMDYFAGHAQPNVTLSQAVTNSVSMQTELVKNWNYYLLVSGCTTDYTNYNNTSQFHGAWVQLGNQNPTWPTSAISFWAQLSPNNAGYSSTSPYISSKNLPVNHYMKNSSGQFLDLNGNVTTTKVWSSAAPVDSLYKDGLTQKVYLQSLLNSMTRPLNIICENGEVIPKPYPNAYQNDPSVVADQTASGLDWETYFGNRKLKDCSAYRDKFMSLSGLTNTKYVEYQISGATVRHKYSETRNISTAINGQHYATPDFYPRWAYNWRTGVSAWNGWQHVIEGRYYELQQNDKLFSPFVAAGWSLNQEDNICPAQWLGLLKALGMTGAEFYYAGFFDDAASYSSPNPPPADPAGYAWQAVVPSYAQATTSRFEDILRSGSLLPGDVLYNEADPTEPGYSFNAGDPRKLVVIRKHDTQNRYAIVGTIQPNSNMQGNTELESDATIKLNAQNLQFKIRRQGSTYIYDLTNPSAPVFYQLDAWHEATHPYRWSKDFNFEAELYDNTPAQAVIKTQVPANTSAGDFRNYTSYVGVATGATTYSTLEYYFTPRAQQTYSFWVRARSKNGVAGGLTISLNNQNQKSIGCVTDTAWNWYSLDACSAQAIQFQNLSNQEYDLMITPTSASIEIDRMLLTIDPALNLNANQASCGASGGAITSSGPLSFCQGNNVVLTASAGTSYQWASGQTTQSITVSASGSYSVVIGNSTGCNASPTPSVVTVLSKPTPTITASGSTSICQGQNVSLSSTSGVNYNWSNGSTTQSISINTSGNYSVTVTNSNGCSATSAIQAVSVSALPIATVTTNGQTTFCQGGSVSLSAPSGNTYLWSNGKTTQNLSVYASGSYVVTVTAASGCSATSQPVNVTVNSLPTATISANGTTTFCNGGSVNLTSTGGGNYIWSNGSTASTISVSQTGTFTATVTNASGCSATSNSINVVVNQNPTATISASGSTTICNGGSVNLIASGGTNYLWSNGSTASTVSISQSGTYNVSVTNASGCSATSNAVNIVVNQNPVATISASGSTTFCSGGSVILSATGGGNYLWSNGSTSSTISVSQGGNYNAVVTNANGCSSTSNSISIVANQNPVATISANGATTFCNGGSVNLSSTGGVNYLWSNGSTASTISVTQSGIFKATVTNANGCSATSNSISVVVNQNPVATISANGSTTFCVGGSVDITSTSGKNYLWSNGSTASTISVSQSGIYNAVVSNTNGCTATSNSINVIVNQNPVSAIIVSGPTAIASGQSTLLIASSGSSYVWQPGGMVTQNITVTNPGTYSVTVVDSNNCSSVSSPITITSSSATPSMSIQASGPISFCQGGSVHLTAKGASNYLWSPGGATTASITATNAGTYYVYARDSSGQVIGMDSMTVVVNPAPMTPWISITYIPNTAYQLTAFEPSAVSYKWSNGQSTSSLNVVTPQTLTVKVTNAFGCISSAQTMTTSIVNARTCISPDMLTAYNIDDTTATLGWNPGITGEQIAVRYWQAGSSSVTTKYLPGNSSTYKLNMLAAGTTYNYTIQTVCASGNNTSVVGSFSTLGTPLNCGSVPQQLRTDNINTNRVTVTWYATTAQSFLVRYRELGAAIYKLKTFSSTQSTGGIISNLLPSKTYEWSVQSTCNGYTSPFSPPVYFTTIDTCGYLGSLAVLGSTASTANIQWSNTSAMDTVRILITDENTSIQRHILLKGNPVNGIYIIHNLKPNTTYAVQARGKCSSGALGAWTNTVTFSTNSISLREDGDNPLFLNGYPNPSSDILYYSFLTKESSDYIVKVCDLSGRELLQDIRNAEDGDNVGEIPVSNFAKGIYMLIVQKGTQCSRFRFAVQ